MSNKPIEDEDRYNITPNKVLDMLYEDRALAHKAGKLTASISVAKLFGDSIGMFKTTTENNTTLKFIKPFGQEDKDALEALGLNFAQIEIDPTRS
ncbi:MAG TPA: hypothetical protein VNW06_03395 [Cytophagaceae bacterium]|jgi:hypothetical protein|nr:hypothetical protein [Cytophagaceae bacterium]